MQEVAKHLHDHALTDPNTASAALFVRSACNRYYYSVYLTLRAEVFRLLGDTNRFKHGGDASKQIHGAYKKRIKDKLQTLGLSYKGEEFEALVKEINQKFVFLYDIRQEADYYFPIITMENSDAKIEFFKKTKSHKYNLSEIQKVSYEMIVMISQLEVYRKMAGL